MKRLEKIDAIICLIMLCVSLIALPISILYNQEKLYSFWMIMLGSSIGVLLAYKKKYKGEVRTFLYVLFLAMISISLSLLLYAILGNGSIIYILLLNVCAIAYSIALFRKQKKNNEQHPCS